MVDPVPLVIAPIVARHFEEAAILWQHRDADAHGTQRTFEELADLDGRVNAQLDGLRIAQSYGWDESTIEPNLSDPGEAFVRTLLSLEGKKSEALEKVLEAVAGDEAAVRGVVSGFGWASSTLLRGTVKELLASTDAFRRRVGIAACAVHRVDPGNALGEATQHDDVALRRRALRAIGELGRSDQASVLQMHFQSSDPWGRFWAAWSGVLTGDRGQGLQVLCATATADHAQRARGMQIVLRVVSSKNARDWLRHVRDNKAPERDVLAGIGIAGDPSYIPWLIAQMEVPEQSRMAGEAFSMITGVDLYDAQLTRDRPDGFESGPTDNPEDEDVAMDPDQDLVWPDPQLVRTWWDQHGHRFVNGQRYLAGNAITPEHCERLLREGRQGFRQAAAYELALMNAETPLFEVRAPAARQQRLLGR
jgi:uncharacterized protein (TIGR02270 family)